MRPISDHRRSHSTAVSSGSGALKPVSAALTPDRWDAHPRSPAVSVASSSAGTTSSSGSRRSGVKGFLGSIGSFFRKREAPLPSTKPFDELTPSGKPLVHNSSYGSVGRRSVRGIGSSGRGNSSVRGIGSSGRGSSSVRFKSGIFTKEEIQRATKNFSPALKIGEGGFGTVYKGKLDDGTIVAVKRAKKGMQPHISIEFQSEIKILGRVEHLNLVRFYGYLESNDERIIVVEYVPNGNLREHLDGINGKHLDFGARLDIAIDVAHAVTYLHMYTDHPIIHRDIKASNILLTESLRAKVADFGFARLGAGEAGVTHVSTQVKGTAGYLDPEYLKTFQLTEKSDVFSFGVLLVELISGRRPIDPNRQRKERITMGWAMKKFTDGRSVDALDPNLALSPATNLALEKVLELAFQCVAPTRESRPSMRRCAEILWNIRKDYRELLLSSSDAAAAADFCHWSRSVVVSGKSSEAP